MDDGAAAANGGAAEAVPPAVPPLPPAFLEFLEENGLDPSIYAAENSIPRYIRIKPGCEDQIAMIEEELECELQVVDWLPGFYFIPPQIQIASSSAYKLGKIYGMDAASGAAVSALNISPGDHILDLCAAPGAKLCMLAELLGCSGSLTGVDIARHRIAACRTMLQKYALGDQCRLFLADGSTFSLLPLRSHVNRSPCNGAIEDSDRTNTFAEWTSKRSWKDRKNVFKAGGSNSYHLGPELMYYGKQSGVIGLQRNAIFRSSENSEFLHSGYDKVIVDAECTHDGSIKHIHKYHYWGWETFQRRVLDAKRTDSLAKLQSKLLTNGFRLLKVGGSLVYSTCSLTAVQNEDVVEQFLAGNPTAELVDIDVACKWRCRSGRIPKTLRFDPKTSQTSGLFVAKLTKLPT